MLYNNEKSYRTSHLKEKHGQNYETHFSGDNYNARMWKLEKFELEKIIKKHFGNKKIENYLDFACGTGRVCSFLENKVESSAGIDISNEMIKVAKQKCVKTNFIIGDLSNDKIFDRKFDLISTFRFFLNAEDKLRKDILSKLVVLLKDNGILIFNIHGNKNSIRHIPILLQKFFGKIQKSTELSIQDVHILLEANNLAIKGIYGTNFFPQFFSSILPLNLWLLLEKLCRKVKFLNNHCINLIFVVTKNGQKKKV